MSFASRQEAGRRLAEQIKKLGVKKAVVYAIPRGGVPVARLVAENLRAELDVLLAHKFTSTWRAELALGSVTDAGDIWFAPHATKFLTEEELQEAATSEVERLKHKRAKLSPLREPIAPEGRDVIIVDDGIATGATAIAAVRAMRGRNAGRIIVAVPVASPRAFQRLREEGVEVCAIMVPDSFRSVSEFYDDFSQVSDADVMALLKGVGGGAGGATRKKTARLGAGVQTKTGKDIQIGLDDASLNGTLRLPARAHGVVIFAHGSGTSRKSPRNQMVARALHRAGFATLLLDLLEENEAADRWRVFDTDLLAKRLRKATEWLGQQEKTSHLPKGYFGSGTGAAAALKTAAALPEVVRAVVSQGGRPDLAAEFLPIVQSPTLLIVGDKDKAVLELNRRAIKELECENALVTVPGAGHLFEEAGALEEVARVSQSWFERFMKEGASPLALTPFDEPPAPPP